MNAEAVLLLAIGVAGFILYLAFSVATSSAPFKRAKSSPGGGGWIVVLILAVIIGIMVLATASSTRPDIQRVIHGSTR